MISEYDKRQIAMMKEVIERFKSNLIMVNALLNDLYALLNCLESANQEWRSKFVEIWGEVDTLFACAIAQERVEFNSNEIKKIAEALNKLEMIIDQYK
jgi:hypothetical protein